MNKNGETVYAFIDSQNLNLGVQNDIIRRGKKIYSGWKLDFKRFYVHLQDRYGVDRAYLFIGRKPGEEKLHRFLEKAGYNVVYKPTVRLPDGTTKGNVDAELIVHAMTENSSYDKAIIVAGDGDYAVLAKYLDEQGKLDRILAPNKLSYSSLLKPYALKGKMSYVSDMKKRLEYRKRGHE